jgi:tRNA pseudouridine55 synthase
MNGFLNVLKPPGMTSSDMVVALRRILHIKKIGHTGTLDPDAAGVLAVAIGRATRAIEYAADVEKAYRCRLILGVSTDTDDLEGRFTYTHTGPLPGMNDLKSVIHDFIGDIQQTPPTYSAVKINGKRAYKLAREGQEVSIAPREVNVHAIELLREAGAGQFDLDIACGKGVYIRSLCRDMGKALGCGGTMGYLIRTENGPFAIADSLTPDEIKDMAEERDIEGAVVPMDEMLAHLPSLTWPVRYYKEAVSGRPLPLDHAEGSAEGDSLYRMYCGLAFVGIGTILETESEPVVRFRKMLAG